MTWKRLPLAVVLIFAVGLMTGCADMPKVTGPAAPTCAPQANYEIAYQAELVSVSCAVKKYKGENSLFFTVAFKNCSNEPLRYRVNIFLPSGKAVGGLVPRKGKPPVVKPGQTVKVSYPFKGVTQKPKSFELLIKTLGN